MKKRVFLAAALAAVVGMANGQNLLDGNKAKDNWSLGLNVGGITPLTHSAFWKNMRPEIGLELGKQFTPVFGLSVEGMFGINTSYGYSSTAIDNSNLSMLGRVNLFNWLGGYKGYPRVFEMELVGGMGWGHAYIANSDDANYATSKVGLNFNFNLGSKEQKIWTLAFKPALVYNLEGQDMYGEVKGARYNANYAAVELLAGLTYHFKNSNGKHYMTWAKRYDQAEIDALNGKINDLRADSQNKLDAANQKISDLENQLNDCSNQLSACQNKKPQVQTVKETNQTLESVVTFRQGRATIDASQLPNVERIATYLKNHKNAAVSIKGYASPEGSAEANARIAKQRAEAVKTLLVNKYKIAANRIEAEGQGVGNMFEEPDWNRVSICTIDKK
ncbi:MAG: OmpA family protein [Mediterranea sp.]|jgi:outer membrane protein OmpA-like peptidoglycan-associated protein|nr:OmpA family protein [Mediterranea sp.]